MLEKFGKWRKDCDKFRSYSFIRKGSLMKKLIMMLVILLGFGFSNVIAEELSCDELKEVAEVLDDVADVLSEISASDIKGNQDFDQKLGKLLKLLEKIGEAEDSKELQDNTEEVHAQWDVDGEWTEDEWAEFKRTFDSVINSFERIHNRECG